MRRAAAEMARALSGLRRVELLCRRAARPADGARCGESPLRPGLGRSGGASSTATSRHPTRREFRRASRSSIACLAAASCRARSCCSAASRASASPRCCCRWRRTWRGPSVRCSTVPAKNPNIKSSCAANASRSIARRFICSPKHASSAFSKRSSGSSRRSSSSIRFRRYFRRGFNRLRAASARCARWRPTCCLPPRAATFRSCSSGTSRKTAISPARKRWSTSSIRFCTSKGSAIMRTASCARSRTGSAPRTSWACSR